VCLAGTTTALGVDGIDEQGVCLLGELRDVGLFGVDGGDDLRADAAAECTELARVESTVDLHHVRSDSVDATNRLLDGIGHRHEDARRERWDSGDEFDSRLLVDRSWRVDGDTGDDADGVRAGSDDRVPVLGARDAANLHPGHAPVLRRSASLSAALPDSMACSAISTPSRWEDASPET